MAFHAHAANSPLPPLVTNVFLPSLCSEPRLLLTSANSRIGALAEFHHLQRNRTQTTCAWLPQAAPRGCKTDPAHVCADENKNKQPLSMRKNPSGCTSHGLHGGPTNILLVYEVCKTMCGTKPFRYSQTRTAKRVYERTQTKQQQHRRRPFGFALSWRRKLLLSLCP